MTGFLLSIAALYLLGGVLFLLLDFWNSHWQALRLSRCRYYYEPMMTFWFWTVASLIVCVLLWPYGVWLYATDPTVYRRNIEEV